MKKSRISSLSKKIIYLAAIALVISLFVPIWSIYLDAPQYPEGLSLQIWANKLAGDVDIMNGLNHYIGMKTLHTDDFIEFTILPYIIGAFVLFFLATATWGNRKLLIIALIAFILFGVVSMIDFWKWEYDYGHDLDPNAAIQVPGMAYQPPLIGFKQLLNFGAYSVPNIGGWLFVAAGLLLVVAVFIESKRNKKAKVNIPVSIFLLASFFLASCSSNGPVPINYNKDACDYCKMTISESRFATELITAKGRAYKFDDLSCMLHYMKDNADVKVKSYYVGDSEQPNILIDATAAFFVKHESIRSPMGGNTAAFATKDAAQKNATQNQTQIKSWNDLQNVDASSDHQDHNHDTH